MYFTTSNGMFDLPLVITLTLKQDDKPLVLEQEVKV